CDFRAGGNVAEPPQKKTRRLIADILKSRCTFTMQRFFFCGVFDLFAIYLLLNCSFIFPQICLQRRDFPLVMNLFNCSREINFCENSRRFLFLLCINPVMEGV
ncbi:hypothetical protein, partial [Anaerovibrio sp.]|uniref:hypothetical protein n=1 Tax=Anaerovibrio sp. TaxID=1872532 RepID=UPI003F188E66